MRAEEKNWSIEELGRHGAGAAHQMGENQAGSKSGTQRVSSVTPVGEGEEEADNIHQGGPTWP